MCAKELSKPKANFRIRLNEKDNLSLTFWATKNDPAAEVVVAEIRRRQEDTWESVGRIAVYRSPEGEYSQLPTRKREEV